MPSVNVKRGVQFRSDLFAKSNRNEWFDAVGKELEAKGVSVKVGTGPNAKVVKDSATLQAAMKELQAAASAAGASLRGYISDLTQALDDVVKGDAKLAAGDVFDFSQGSKLSAALGIDDGLRSNYASMSTTEFGKASRTRPEATMTIDGVTLQIREPTAVNVDLSTIPHMSAETLRNAPVAYGRDGEEVEDTRVITGLTKEQTVGLAGEALGDLQRPRAAAGLTLGRVPVDEMSWDSDAHALRRANPYVSFTLDDRSYEIDTDDGEPRVGIGRDFFFDTFMAKKDLTTGKLTKDLQKAELMYRDRIRYGSDRDPFQGTRVLVGMKAGTYIDAGGTKHGIKIDSRTDSANQQVFDGLHQSAITGKLGPGWSNAGSVAPAAAAVHRAAVQAGITDTVGGETQVLAMEPGAVARQIRARYHLNETDSSSLVEGFNAAGEPKIGELTALITAAPDWAASGNLPSKAQLLAQAQALTDRSAIVAAATDELKKLDPNLTVDKALIDRLWPGANLTDKKDVRMQRAVVDAIRTTYDAFAENVDELQRNIGGSTSRAVRDAGSANDVQDFLRQKAAVARVMAHAERSREATPGNAASYTAFAQKVLAMPDGDARDDLLQRLGVGTDQLEDMNDAAFASAVKVNPDMVKKQTFEAFLQEFDAQLAGPNKDVFLAELGAHLSSEDNDTLQNATDKTKVAGDIRKNLVTAHAEVLHRQVEGAAGWGQAIWFNNYREANGINPQSWNFIIASMDYTEFYDAKTGDALTFQERVSRRPLDATKMTGAMISNDHQIELEAEEGYTAAVRTAQYGVNSAAAGILMDYAKSLNLPDVSAGTPEAFEAWFAKQAALPQTQREFFLADVNTFAKQKGSTVDVAKEFGSLVEQEKAIRLLSGFAARKNPALDVGDRTALEGWVRSQARLPAEELEVLLKELAQFAADNKSDVPLSPNLLRTLDFEPFAASNAGQPYAGHGGLVQTLSETREIWEMVKQSQRDLSAARGAEVQAVLEDNGIRDAGWDPPTKPKGDYGIDFALGPG